jgi:hypothetical protein
MAFVSAYAVVCEKSLTEKDNVVTLVRVVEVFFIPPEMVGKPDSPPVLMTVYLNIRVTHDDEDPHTVALDLVRPDGETVPIPISGDAIVLKGKYPGLHRSMNATGHVGVFPKQAGEHYFAVNFDGKEVARVYFTLLPHETETALTPN